MNNNMTLFDGRSSVDLMTGMVKSIDLPQYPDEAWSFLSGKPSGADAIIQDYHKAIPFLFRGTDMRAARVSSMPFGIFRGDTEIDSSDDYQNVVKFMPNPKRLFALVEMSLTLLGKSYLFNVRNNVVTTDLKYLNPTTVEPVIVDPEGLIGFKRRSTHRTHNLAVEDIIYFWPGDPWVELGPPTASPGTASLMASGVLANVDEFIAGYFKRGAIKAMLFRAKGMSPADRKTFLAWWKRFVTGVRNAFTTKILNADSMEPIVVGEGIEGLQDQDLNNEKQKEIATALGVPQSMLFSNAANRATAKVDLFNFYDQTIVPEAKLIFSILNEQVFDQMGLRIKDKHETLDVFQADEQVRSTAYAQYVGSDMLPSVAGEMLGLELPAGVEYADLDTAAAELRKEQAANRPTFGIQESPEASEEREASEEKSIRPENVRAMEMVAEYMADESEGKSLTWDVDNGALGVGMTAPVIDPRARADLDKWKRKALRLFDAGKSPDCGFTSKHLSGAAIGAIRLRLQSATTEDMVKAAFTDITDMAEAAHKVNDGDIFALTNALLDASKALRETAVMEVE